MKPKLLAIMVCFACGCGKQPPPEPDGSSGIRGVCLLPTRLGGGERGRWAGVQVIVSQALDSGLPYDEHATRVLADANGEFRVALNPGKYDISAYDPKLLKGKGITGGFPKATVDIGRYAEVVIDFEKLKFGDIK